MPYVAHVVFLLDSAILDPACPGWPEGRAIVRRHP